MKIFLLFGEPSFLFLCYPFKAQFELRFFFGLCLASSCVLYEHSHASTPNVCVFKILFFGFCFSPRPVGGLSEIWGIVFVFMLSWLWIFISSNTYLSYFYLFLIVMTLYCLTFEPCNLHDLWIHFRIVKGVFSNRRKDVRSYRFGPHHITWVQEWPLWSCIFIEFQSSVGALAGGGDGAPLLQSPVSHAT